jgi:RNA polymerase sigma-70 factor (ECF subfamily)
LDHQITELLSRVPTNQSLAGELMPLVYDQLRVLAANYLDNERAGHTLQATALVNDAYLKLVGRDASYESRSHFFAAAAIAMRQILIDHARARKAAKRGGGVTSSLSIEGVAAEPVGLSADRLLEIDAAMRKLSELDPRRARVLEMRVFGGMTYEQIGLVLGIGKSTAADDWTVARAFLAAELADGQGASS